MDVLPRVCCQRGACVCVGFVGFVFDVLMTICVRVRDGDGVMRVRHDDGLLYS